MSLEKDRTTRSYLYGRLLAVADVLEQAALRTAGENRDTNAARDTSQSGTAIECSSLDGRNVVGYGDTRDTRTARKCVFPDACDRPE